MSFRIGSTLDPEKAFLVPLSETAGRLDPSFHRPYFRRRRAEIDSGSFSVVSLGGLKGRIFQGVGRNLVAGAPTWLLKVKNITPDGEIDLTDTEPVADVPKPKLLQPGDIISPFIGAAIKGYKFAKFAGAEQDCAVDNNTGVIRITDGRISTDYLHAFCQTGLVRWQLDQLTGGGGVPFLGSEYARRIRLPLPPEGLQKAAVAMLRVAKWKKNDAEEKASALLRRIDDVLLDELGITRKAAPANTLESRIFRTPFSELTGQRWDPNHAKQMGSFLSKFKGCKHPVRKLKDFVATVQYGISERATTDEVGVPMLRMLNLQDGEWALDDMKYIAMTDKEKKPYLLKKGDILFNRTNSKELVGKCNVVDFNGEFVFASYLMRVSLKADAEMLPEFVVAYMASSLGRMQIDAISRQIAGMTNINAEEVRELLIPAIGRKNQERICLSVASIREQARALRQKARADLEKAKRDIEALILGKEAAE